MTRPYGLAVCLLLAAAMVPAAATARGASGARAFLAGGMRPDVVAQSLVSVEGEWRAMAAASMECNATAESGDTPAAPCNDASSAFAHSCSKVVTAMIHGSSGDRGDVREYMGAVCGSARLEGWRREQCQSLATAVDKAMSEDSYANRQDLDAGDVCTGFWSTVTSGAKALVEEERRAREEEAQRRAEEEKKRAEEEAEMKKQEEEERQKKEEERKAQEAAAEEERKKEKEATAKQAQEAREAAAARTAKEAEEARQRAEEAAVNATAMAAAVKEAREAAAAVTNSTVTAAAVKDAAATTANSTASQASTEAPDANGTAIGNATTLSLF